MSTLHLDYCIIGGGIVGLAVGAALAPFGSVAVLERHTRLLQETSSRNSGVVHSGLYYPAASLKTKLCLEGNKNIWRLKHKFPEAINAQQIGKWIGSCDAGEDAVLEGLITKMRERHIRYEMVSAATARREEPLVQMRRIVNSTSTGIVDVHTLADFYRDVIEGSAEGYVLCGSHVSKVDLPEKPTSQHATLEPVEVTVANAASSSSGNADAYIIEVDKAVICATGLHANALWSSLYYGGLPIAQPPAHRLYACKGRYAGYRGKAPVSRLVYPCPLPNLVGLGVHSVIDTAGHVRFGPDAVYVESFEDVSVVHTDEEEANFLDSQFAAVKRYMPSVERGRFFADFAGIRPKLARPGEGFRDFLIEAIDNVVEEKHLPMLRSSSTAEKAPHAQTVAPVMKSIVEGEEHTAGNGPTVVWLNGIESPGLTASSAIGDHVASWLVGRNTYQTHLPPWRA